MARRRISGTVIALVEREEPGESGVQGGAVRGRATVCNQQGEVLLELDRITLKAAKPAASTESTAPAVAAAPAERADSGQGLSAVPLIETVAWRRTDVAPGHSAAVAPDGPVLIVSAHDLRPPASRHGVHLTPAQLSAGGLDTLPDDGADFRDVVYVAPRGQSGEAQVTDALQGVFALVRRLAARPPMPNLLIVTSTAHQVATEDVVDPFMTALWGLGRTLRVEHPRTSIRLVDLGHENAVGPEDGDAADLWEALGQDRLELARRADSWYEPSVQPQPTSTADPVRYRGGRFLITGGMGGIGLRVAEFLAEEGCAHLTLVGRTVPDRGEARERLDRLGARCDLTVVAADVRSLHGAPDLGVSPEGLRGWVKQAKVDRGEGPAGALTTDKLIELL